MSTRYPFIAVYIMASARYGTLYLGCTNDLRRRAYEHREGLLPGFTKRYACTRLVWYESHTLMVDAISRERSMKRWPREWKINLIERENLDWSDLYASIV